VADEPMTTQMLSPAKAAPNGSALTDIDIPRQRTIWV